MIARTTLSTLLLSATLPLASAQATKATATADGASTSSESVVEVSRSTSKNGKTEKRHYRRVLRDGKVVEESGDRSLLGKGGRGGKPVEVDAEKMLERMRRELASGKQAGASTSTKSHTRRVVVIDGKTVVDEETVDGKRVPGKVKVAPQPKVGRRGAIPGQEVGRRKPGAAPSKAKAGKSKTSKSKTGKSKTGKSKTGKTLGNRLERVR